MHSKIEAYEIVKFTNEEKKRLIEVLKHFGASRIEEDNLGRIFGFFEEGTVTLEKNKDLNDGKFLIIAHFSSPELRNIALQFAELKLVDKIMLVDSENKIIRVAEIRKDIKSEHKLLEAVKTSFQKLSAIAYVFFF